MVLIFLSVEAAEIVTQVASAIHYLHSMNIAHRDLKVNYQHKPTLTSILPLQNMGINSVLLLSCVRRNYSRQN